MIYTHKGPALARANSEERQTGCSHYVVRTVEGYEVTDTMPLLGMWWTSDGIRHG